MLDKNKIYNFDELSSIGMIMLLAYLYKPNSKHNFTYTTLDLVRKK